MQLMNQSGLTDLAMSQGGRSMVNIENATFADATDADLVAQRTVAAFSAMALS
jgi:hypothetical protein